MALIGIWTSPADGFATFAGDVTTNTGAGVPAASAPGLRVGDGTGAATARLTYPSPASEVTTSFYVKTPSAWPSQSFNIHGIRPSITTLAVSIALGGQGSPGQIRLLSTGVMVTNSDVGVLEVNSEYRFVTRYNKATTSATVDVFKVNGPPDPIWSTSYVDSVNWNQDINFADFGRLNSTPTVLPFLLDRLEAYDDIFVDPPRDANDVPVIPPATDYPLYWYGDGDQPDLISGIVTMMNPGGYPSDAYFKVEQAAGAPAYVQWNLPEALPILSSRLFFKTPDVWPSASFGLILFRPSLATNGPSATISGSGQPGQLRLTAGATTLSQSANNTLATSTWYRIELQHKIGTSEARVAAFHLGLSTPLWYTPWMTHASFNTACPIVQVGRTTSNPQVGAFRVSDIMIHNEANDWLGGGNEQGVTWGVWNGSVVKPASAVQVWTGGTLKNIL